MPKLLLGYANGEPVDLPLSMANRHGLIAGATGTGKTISLKIMVEQLSAQGVPCFVSDVKGDLSGLAKPGTTNKHIDKRVEVMDLKPFTFEGFPVTCWDLDGSLGHPIRTTVSEFGPLLLGRLLDLNETQQSVLTVLFEVADDEGLMILDLKDLKAILRFAQAERKELQEDYGSFSPATLSAIQRKVVALEAQGLETFFAEPAVSLFDFIRTDSDGRGQINLLAAETLMQQPKRYATFLLWLLSELFEELPEVGDLDKPRLALFFDEAHLLFDDLPDALLNKLKQVMLLIRSKGVAVFYITQNPQDIADAVRGQLGHRIQHALRAYSATDRKKLKALAGSFPANPDLDVETVLGELGVGEALISVLDENGVPSMAAQTLMAPPKSYIGPLTDSEREALIKSSLFFGRYDTVVDAESAHEVLLKRRDIAEKRLDDEAAKSTKSQTKPKSRRSTRQSPMEAFIKSAVRSVGSQIGRQLVRGLLGGLTRR